MRYSKSKHLVKSNLSEDSSLNTILNDFERDNDDPSSVRSLSTTSLGIIFAILTILLPTIGVLIGRPFSQDKEMNFNHFIKKDGS